MLHLTWQKALSGDVFSMAAILSVQEQTASVDLLLLDPFLIPHPGLQQRTDTLAFKTGLDFKGLGISVCCWMCLTPKPESRK